MQKIPIVLLIVIILVVFYYYPPLRNLIFPKQEPAPGLVSSQKTNEKEAPFDKLGLEVYAAGIKLENLRGKVRLLKMGQKNQDWFKPEEYAQLPMLLAHAEDELKQVEAEYEKLKIKYAQETVLKMINESKAKKDSERPKW